MFILEVTTKLLITVDILFLLNFRIKESEIMGSLLARPLLVTYKEFLMPSSGNVMYNLWEQLQIQSWKNQELNNNDNKILTSVLHPQRFWLNLVWSRHKESSKSSQVILMQSQVWEPYLKMNERNIFKVLLKWQIIYFFLHSLRKYLLNTYYMLSTLLGLRSAK